MLLKGITGEDPYRGVTPSGSLVDAYPMADGRLIHEAGSSYDPKNLMKVGIRVFISLLYILPDR